MTQDERNEAIRRAMSLSSQELAEKMSREPRLLGRAIVQANCDRQELIKARRQAIIEAQIERFERTVKHG